MEYSGYGFFTALMRIWALFFPPDLIQLTHFIMYGRLKNTAAAG
jgi:hypothetical protein